LNSDLPARFCWTNWQAVASLLESIIARKPHGLAHHERCHAQDLLDLLDRKNLRSFGGFNLEGHFTPRDRIFFEVESASFRGSFIGFEDAMSGCTMIDPVLDIIFFKNGTARPQRSFFEALGKTNLNAVEYDRIFFQRRSK
jgi:hypothetical protein